METQHILFFPFCLSSALPLILYKIMTEWRLKLDVVSRHCTHWVRGVNAHHDTATNVFFFFFLEWNSEVCPNFFAKVAFTQQLREKPAWVHVLGEWTCACVCVCVMCEGEFAILTCVCVNKSLCMRVQGLHMFPVIEKKSTLYISRVSALY